MRPRLSAHCRASDADFHPLHIASRRIAEVRAQALATLLVIAAGLSFAIAAALISILVRQ